MARSILDRMVDSIFDENWVGKRGEKLTERELHLVGLFGRKGMTLRNIYLPNDNGETSEVDLIYITRKGIFVFESKNYSGWIFGDENAQYWTVTLPNQQKNRFYNPIRQNRTHIQLLKRYIGAGIPCFSIIVFSERCEFKKITVASSDVKVIQRDKTYAAVRDIWDSVPDVLSDETVTELYEQLRQLTNVDKATKAAHISRIEKMKKSTLAALAEKRICPRCGKQLVLRTAKSGVNAGKQFWGCTGYPDCKYTDSLQ